MGPEESGRVPVRGCGLVFLGHGHTGFGFGVVGGWGRLSPNCLVGSLDGCVVSLDGVLVWWVVVVGLVFLPVF